MQKVLAICFVLLLAVSMVGCDKKSNHSETEASIADAATEASNAEYGILQDLVDAYGFPFELRYTEGMELTNIRIYEDCAKRQWHTNKDNTTHDTLTWNLTGTTLEICGDWNESFSLDMERGSATSLKDGMEYRMVVHLPDSIDTKWYVSWPGDEGWTEIDGVRYDSAAAQFANAVDLCQFVKDCLAEPDSFQIHGVSHMEENGHHFYYLEFSHQIKKEEMERTYYYAEFDGSTLLYIINENSAIYYQTDGDYTTKYPGVSAMFRERWYEQLNVERIVSDLS